MAKCEKMQAVASELRRLVTAVTPRLDALSSDAEFAVRPRPDKWARKEVLGHLIDSACNNHQKFVRMMHMRELDFVGYRQDDWVDVQNYAAADWSVMIALWQSYNQHIAYLIENADPSLLTREVRIESAGPFTLEFIMADYVEHMKHHLNQIFPGTDFDSNFVNVYGA